jgi:hypothetical protein
LVWWCEYWQVATDEREHAGCDYVVYGHTWFRNVKHTRCEIGGGERFENSGHGLFYFCL